MSAQFLSGDMSNHRVGVGRAAGPTSMPQSRSGKRKVVFHVGLERTGTTWLQYILYRNRKVLAEHGVLYPTNNGGFRGFSHVDLVASYLYRDPTDYFVRTPVVERGRILDSLKKEIETSPAHIVLLSSEFFSSRLRGPQIEAVAADFAEFDCQIVIFLRRHVPRLFSLYATHVASGGRLTLDAFADEVLHPDNLSLRYADTIAGWEAAFGKANLALHVHDRQRGVLSQLFDERGAAPLDSRALAKLNTRVLDPFALRGNRSLGPRWTARLRAVNAPYSGPAANLGGIGWIERRIRHDVGSVARSGMHLAASAERLLFGPDDSRWPLDAARLEALTTIASADEAALSQRYGLRLS